MIMPNKCLNEYECLLGAGGFLIVEINKRKKISINYLWEIAKKNENIEIFERFILTLDFLFSLGVINISGDTIYRFFK